MMIPNIGVNENIASKIIPGSIIRCKAIWSFLRFMPDRSFLLFDSLVHFLSNLFTVCSMDQIHAVITDPKVSKEILSTAHKNNISIITV